MKKILFLILSILIASFGFSHAESGLSIRGDYNDAKQVILNNIPDTIKQGVSKEFSIFEKSETKDQKKEELQKIVLMIADGNNEENMNTIIMPQVCTILNINEIPSEICKTQNYLNTTQESNILRIGFIIIGIVSIIGIILFILSKISEKLRNYIIFGTAGLFVVFLIVAAGSNYPGFWQSAGTIIGGFVVIFVGLVIFFLHRRKQEIKKLEEKDVKKYNEIEEKKKIFQDLLDNACNAGIKKDFENALKGYNQCIEIIKNGGIPDITDQHEYEQILSYKKDVEKIINLKQEIKDGSKESFIMLGEDLFSIGETEKGISIYEEAIKKFPKERDLYALLGNHYFQLGKKEEAVKTYYNYLDIDSTWKEGLLAISSIQEEFKQYEKALETINRSIEIDKTYKDAYLLKGEILNILGREDEQLNTYYKGFENTNYEGFILNIGYILQKQEKYEEAIKQYNEALKISPMNEQIYTNKTGCLLALKRYQEAEESANYSLDKINPNCISILINKACILKETNRDAEALDILNKAIALDPKHANSYFNKASILLKQKNIAETLVLLQKTFELDPNFKKIILTEDEFKEILDLDEFKKLI